MMTVSDSVLPLLNEGLDRIAQLLDIPEDVFEEATARYEAVATWLGDEDSPLARFAPELYPQGSFRLGTPIRPLGANDEFDIDLVCRLHIAKDFDETTYDRLDVATRRDRLGRVTRYYHDALRRLVATRDPAGRTIEQRWGVGGLRQLVDAKGQTTTWARDLAGRVTRELRADGVTATLYAYQPLSGRLQTVTDPKGQVTTYTYNLDDTVQQVVYSNAPIATPSVSYTYDPVYSRVATMVDGTGTTSYTYHPAGGLGAGQVATVDGPLPNDTIAYTYDELGRMVSRAINGAANTMTQVYDALGRVTSETNVLGTFAYGYVGATGRLSLVTYPNGQTSSYAYYDNLGDQRLQTIHHRKPDASTLSRFDYTYDAAGNILTWLQQADSDAPTLWVYGYDRADQLTSALHQTTGATPSLIKRYAYTYDLAGNRTSEQIDDAVTLATHDSLNRLLTHQAGGPLVFEGTLDEPGTVRINGQPAEVDGSNRFRAAVPVASGTTTVTINAVDASGNAAEAVYEVDQTAAGRTFRYDANGNMTSDGVRTFEWDARNQLVAVNVGTHRSEFVYDGVQRRVAVVETDSGTVLSDRRYIWVDGTIGEERVAGAVRRQFATGGFAVEGIRYYSTFDHLGSTREVVSATGSALGRHQYDPWGRQSLVGDGADTIHGFAAYEQHYASTLALTRYRAYDANLGRWLTMDPAGLVGGFNMYGYANNAPLTQLDFDGLKPECTLVDSRVVLSIPLYLNKKVPVGDWELTSGNGDPPTPDTAGYPTLGSVFHCVWKRLVEREQRWKRILLDTYSCRDECRQWKDRRWRTENRSWWTTDYEFTRTDLFVPVIMDAVLDPTTECNRRGRPR